MATLQDEMAQDDGNINTSTNDEKKKKKKEKKKRKKLVDDEEKGCAEEQTSQIGDDSEITQKTTDEEDISGQTSKRKRKRKRKNKEVTDSSDANTKGKGDSSSLPPEQREIYLEGIPFHCNDDDVKKFFVTNGCSDIEEIRLPKWQDSGRLRGYGHVVFSSLESRKKALDLTGKYIQKRYITIELPKSSKSSPSQYPIQERTQPPKCKTIFVKNIPYDVTEDDVQEIFSRFGEIISGGVRIAINSKTMMSKGFGYVEYKSTEGTADAVKEAAQKGLFLKGRRLLVDYEEKPMKGSFRMKDGKLWKREHPGHVGKY